MKQRCGKLFFPQHANRERGTERSRLRYDEPLPRFEFRQFVKRISTITILAEQNGQRQIVTVQSYPLYFSTCKVQKPKKQNLQGPLTRVLITNVE